jgi:colanic acid/amylovoran biosynthesis glycosyltransferase
MNILYLGRLVDCKGPELVIRAFEQACDRGMDAMLTIAGDGPLRLTCELLRARSPYAGRIEFLGEVDRAAGVQLREKADVFCAHNCLGPITLQEEAFGVAFVEAMAAGLPVVTGRNGSLPEIMEDGKQGILVEPGNVKAQAEAFLRLANDPALRQQMGRSGWERAGQLFSSQQEIARLREILGVAHDCPRLAGPIENVVR